jgi:hypothetical protein
VIKKDDFSSDNMQRTTINRHGPGSRSTSEEIDVTLTLSYSEKQDNLQIIFKSAGKEGNILDTAE